MGVYPLCRTQPRALASLAQSSHDAALEDDGAMPSFPCHCTSAARSMSAPMSDASVRRGPTSRTAANCIISILCAFFMQTAVRSMRKKVDV